MIDLPGISVILLVCISGLRRARNIHPMNIKDIDLNLLTVFHAIYEARSISAAADHLDLSQPGMSHALKRLRIQLNDKLFVRKGNGVAPTAYAESIAEPIRKAITALQMSLDPAADFDPKTSERNFRLMMGEFVEALVMPAFINATIGNPNIRFELIPPQSARTEDAILQGNIDMAVHLQADTMAEIEAEPLFPVEPVLVYRIGHPITQEPNPWAAMSKYRALVINIRGGAVPNLDKARITNVVKRDYLGLVNSLRSVPGFLAETDCVALIPKLYALKMAPIYGLAYAKPPVNLLQQAIVMNWHRRHNDDRALIWLRRLFKDEIAKHQAAAVAILG